MPSCGEFSSAHAAAKFGLEGWMESLQIEVAPFGISTTIVRLLWLRPLRKLECPDENISALEVALTPLR